jgi:2-oxoglutarate ferredoxin oxidoreductase subunit alpha
MIEDVRLATGCRLPVSFYGKLGGLVPLPEEILVEIKKLMGK